MPLVHAITATGWVTEDYPDFVHFFFDMGRGNRIAFFYFFGLPVELIESIYFDDPNGIQLEITRPIRDMSAIDARDAELTLQALVDVVDVVDSPRPSAEARHRPMPSAPTRSRCRCIWPSPRPPGKRRSRRPGPPPPPRSRTCRWTHRDLAAPARRAERAPRNLSALPEK